MEEYCQPTKKVSLTVWTYLGPRILCPHLECNYTRLLLVCQCSVCLLSEVYKLLLLKLELLHVLSFRNGVVKFESVMKLREELDQLGKMQGITQDEKGIAVAIIATLHKIYEDMLLL